MGHNISYRRYSACCTAEKTNDNGGGESMVGDAVVRENSSCLSKGNEGEERVQDVGPSVTRSSIFVFSIFVLSEVSNFVNCYHGKSKADTQTINYLMNHSTQQQEWTYRSLFSALANLSRKSKITFPPSSIFRSTHPV